MAHYAFIDDNNIVTEVITGIDENDLSGLPDGFSNWEEYYQSHDWHSGTCIRTSYNTFEGEHLLGGTAFRGNYAGVGMKYDEDNDVFYEQQPYPSWTLNETTWKWEPPTAYPTLTEEELTGDDVVSYKWDEDTTSWVLRTPDE